MADEEAQKIHKVSDAQVTGHYRSDIDGLRAIAVLAVVIFHIDSTWLPGGFFGVDIFFVISGYVVSGSLARRRFEFIGDFFVDFYARRFRRLFPSFILICSTTGFAIALLSLWFDTEIDRMLKVGVAGTLGNANNWLWLTQDSYFDQRPGSDETNAFLHLWSLGVEEQFYCFFPVIFLAGWGKRVVSTTFWEPSQLLFASFITVLSMTSLGVALKLQSAGFAMSTFYLMPLRFWQLGAGSLLSQLSAGPYAKSIQSVLENRILSVILDVLNVFLLVCSFSNPGLKSVDSTNRVLLSILPVCAAMGCIISGLSSRSILTATLSRSEPVLLGRMSYCIYLWHVPVLSIFRRRFGEMAYLTPLCLFSIMLLSCTNFYLFEQPARNSELATNAEVFAATVAAGSANVLLFQLMIRLRASYGALSGIILVALGTGAICVLLLIIRLPRPSRWRGKKVPSAWFCIAILAGVMILHVGSAPFDSSYAEFQRVFFGEGGEPSNWSQQRPNGNATAQISHKHEADCENTADKSRFSYDLGKGFTDTCECALVDKTTPLFPKYATCSAKATNLPACYKDQAVDQTTFTSRYQNRAECFLGPGWKGREADVRTCLARKHQGKSAVFLLGDSHARSLENGIAAAFGREILPAMWYGSHAGASEEDKLKDLWPVLEDEVVKGDVVWYAVHMPSDNVWKDLYKTQVDELHEFTRKKKAALVLVHDWVGLKTRNPMDCYLHHSLGKPTACAVQLSQVDQQRAGLIHTLKDMQSKEGVYVFNTTMFLCPAGVCDYNIPSRHASAFSDGSHLNQFGSRYLSPFICDFAKSHGLK